MKKSHLLVLSLGAVFATSCSLFEKNVWSWDVSTKAVNGERVINYCLLIGQLDHDDSMQRTGGIRDKLDTRDLAHQLKNKNLENPKVGHLEFGGSDRKITVGDKTYEAPKQVFSVHELEHGEQKSLAGSNWDPITANATTGTWISKHGKKITMFVSNNDGMSEGAIKSYNWYKGMPIFGYDANMSALELVAQDRIMGTIDSTTYGQALATAILTRNIYEASRKIYKDDSGNIYNRAEWIYTKGEDPLGNITDVKTNDKYDPTSEGFIKYVNDVKVTTYQVCYPIVGNDGLAERDNSGTFKHGIASGFMQSPINFDPKTNAVMLRNRALTKEAIGENDGGYVDPETQEKFTSDSIYDFFKEDKKTGLSYPEIFDKFEGYGVVKEESAEYQPIRFDSQFEELPTWQSWGIGSDPYFKTNMNLHFDTVFGGRDGKESPYQQMHPQAGRMFNLAITPAEGDGNDEKKLLDALDSALSKHSCKAFLINLIRQPNTNQYLMKLRDNLYGSPLKEQDSWIKRDDTPVIFWNRRPADEDTNPYPLSENKVFKYVYYVGFDPIQGGRLQGQLIRDWLNRYYVTHEGQEATSLEANNNESK